MSKQILSFLIALSCFYLLSAQKQNINFDIISKWEKVNSGIISNDGNYCMFKVLTEGGNESITLIRGLNRKFELKFKNAGQAVFTQDSKKCIYTSLDTLYILDLGNGRTKLIPSINTFKCFSNKRSEYLVFSNNRKPSTINFFSLNTENVNIYSNTKNYFINKEGDNLLLFQEGLNNGYSNRMQSINLLTGKVVEFATDSAIKCLLYHNEKGIIIFSLGSNEKMQGKEIWMWDGRKPQPDFLYQSEKLDIDSIFQVDGPFMFSSDGQGLLLNLSRRPSPKQKVEKVNLAIWSYKDKRLQPQESLSKINQTFIGYFNIVSKIFNQVTTEDDEELMVNIFDGYFGKYAKLNIHNDSFLLSDSGKIQRRTSTTQYLLNLQTREKHFIRNFEFPTDQSEFSPDERFFIFFDPHTAEYFSYEILNRKLTKIASVADNRWNMYDHDEPKAKYLAYPIAGYLSGTSKVLLCDKANFWSVDMKGTEKAVNLTREYSNSGEIIFSLAMDYKYKIIPTNTPIILTAFNNRSKENGFYELKILEVKFKMKCLMMENALFRTKELGSSIIKAKNIDRYLVTKQTSRESPNYFVTDNFISFTQVSNSYPERAYNWINSTILNWADDTGKLYQGVIYKPDNFNSAYKYPVLIHYYERKSNNLNLYLYPEATIDDINIPYFVSNGYIVIVPDFHYEIGKPGESIMRCLNTLIPNLQRNSWFDVTRMGLQGHSFGGYETNFIITHTNLFAAAMSSSGFANIIRSYGEILPGTSSDYYREWAENGQGRIGYSLWERPDLYIENSPIFYAGNVSTPLLMMNNRNDRIVNSLQGIEFFKALRSLNKKVWLLQYDAGFHSLFLNTEEAKQHTIRVMQFFDHYLKNAYPPKWMTRRASTQIMDSEDGLELDKNEACGIDCKICQNLMR